MESAVADVVRIGGMELRFVVDETQGSGDLVIFEMTVQPNARVPVPHYHREVDEVVYGLAGVLTTIVDGVKREVRARRFRVHPSRRRPSPRESRRRDFAHALRAQSREHRARLFRGDRDGCERPWQARSGAAERDHAAPRPRSGLRRPRPPVRPLPRRALWKRSGCSPRGAWRGDRRPITRRSGSLA